MTTIFRFSTLFLLLALLPEGAGGQSVFGWPVRVTPQPEVVVTGAGAVFWNPGSLVEGVGTLPEVWLAHVNGPDATGIGGVAVSGVTDLPLGFRMGIGYWHLGIQDIPRTTTSPHHEAGEINVTEDVGVVSVARSVGTHTGVGGGIRFQRGAAGRDARSRFVGELGVHHQSGWPLTPRVGFTVMGFGHSVELRSAVEATVSSLASGRLPVRVGYGLHLGDDLDAGEHRVSLRGSWMDQIHIGLGLSHLGRHNGWVPLWHLGAEVGRYTLSVLREDMANGFGAIHFFQASLRFPR